MRSYYPVTCESCGLLLRVPERILPPLYCSCGTAITIPEGIELVTEVEVVREHLSEIVKQQRECWKVLHRFPFSTDWDCKSRCKWWADWQASIPNAGCACRAHWKTLVEEFKPDFSSREAFFAWTVEAHNRVNSMPHLNKSRMSLHDARLLYDMRYALEQPESIPEPRSRLAVVSIASGSHLATLKQTRPLRAAYAERIGADLVELTDDRWPDYPMVNKWRLAAVARRYDRTLYVDSDVIIQPNAPNIFDAVPADAIGLVNELPIVRANGVVQINYEKEYAVIAQEAGWTKPEWCPNGGVIVMPRSLAHVYDPPATMPHNRWCLDQYLLAVDCEKHGAKVELLDERWNWEWIDRRFWLGLDQAWFIHLNGCGDYRRDLIDRIMAGNHKPLRPPPGMWAAFLVGARGDEIYGED